MYRDTLQLLLLRRISLILSTLTILGGAMLLAASGGCSRSSNGSSLKATDSGGEASAVTIDIVKPERKTLQLAVRQPGSIQAFEQTPIFSKIAGYIQKWHVDIGDRVRKGDVLAELWVPEMEAEFKQKEALVRQGEAEIKQARETAAAAETSLRSAAAKVKEAESSRLRALAEYKRMKSQYERLARVGQSGVLDKDTIEESRYGFEAAEAGLEEVEAKVKSADAARDESAAKLNKTRADIAVAEAHLQVAREDRDQVKAVLQYAKLTAPFDGVVTRRNNADTGRFVQPGTGAKAEPLFVVERRDSVRIVVDVPEADVGWVSKGNEARVRVQALGQEFAGEVARTSYSLDPAARTLVAEIDLPNPKDELRSGMYVSATINAEHPNVLTLPLSAVATQGDVTQGYQRYCFMVVVGKAVRTAMRVGRNDGRLVEVLQRQVPGSTSAWEKFTGNETVAAQAAGLADGQAVKPNASTR